MTTKKYTGPRVAAYCMTKNLYERAIPAVKSLLMHSNVDKVYFLIEDDEFPEKLPNCIECINMSDQKYFRPDGPNMNSYFTYMAMIRAALCKIFPQYDRILSLDVDTIVEKDISELWDLPLGKPPAAYYFAAAREPARCEPGYLYTNAGVSMYNLEFLRQGKGQEIIDILNTKAYGNLEQDVFNQRCQRHILLLPGDYNDSFVADRPNERKIIHYVQNPDWTNEPEYIKYRDISWKEATKWHNRNVRQSTQGQKTITNS